MINNIQTFHIVVTRQESVHIFRETRTTILTSPFPNMFYVYYFIHSYFHYWNNWIMFHLKIEIVSNQRSHCCNLIRMNGFFFSSQTMGKVQDSFPPAWNLYRFNQWHLLITTVYSAHKALLLLATSLLHSSLHPAKLEWSGSALWCMKLVWNYMKYVEIKFLPHSTRIASPLQGWRG